MSISFKLGNNIAPEGFPVALLNIPQMSPESNISLVDTSYLWEENISSSDTSIVQCFVSATGVSAGNTSSIGSASFLVTNITTTDSNDIKPAPLYYNHICRFYHYSYGYNPLTQVYITDQYGNVLKGINYIVQATRIAKHVYQVNVLTDFLTGPAVIYKVKYNRCDITGGSILPSWTETLNAIPLFSVGTAANLYQYSLLGPTGGLYKAVVPAVPTLSQLQNSVGVSFQNAPTLISNGLPITVDYAAGVIVTYTLIAITGNTFQIKRDYDRNGNLVNNYLTSATTETWGAVGTNFTLGQKITGLPGIILYVHSDNQLISGDQAYFTASRSYYYLNLTSYESIYLVKPTNATPDDDWYVGVNNGSFRRRMDSSGNVVPSGYGTLYEYDVPEFSQAVWDTTYGEPYQDAVYERAVFLDGNTIKLQHTPLFINPSSVYANPLTPGFPPSGIINIMVNNNTLPENSLVDWDIENGTVKVAQTLSNRDDIRGNYIYEQNYYTYQGFLGSGALYPVPQVFYELELNPSIAGGQEIYASGIVASVFLKPYLNTSTGTVINTNTLYHNFTGIPASGTDFLLGQISLGPNCKIEDIEITDARTRGGGLNPAGVSNLTSVETLQPESQFFWDVGYFDGQAVPLGALVIQVPKSVLISGGGNLSQDDVRAKCYRHCALGTYLVLEFI